MKNGLAFTGLGMQQRWGALGVRLGAFVLTAGLAACGPSTDEKPGTTAGTTITVPVATLMIAANPTTVRSDNTNSSTLTVTALSATNAALPDVTITLGTDTGLVSAQTVKTGADGTATFTFRSGTGNLANRTATITATAGAATAQIPIQISGSTLAVFSTTGTTVSDNGSNPVTVTFIAKDASGVGVAGLTVAVTASPAGTVTLTPASGVTDAAGKFSVAVAGVAGGIGTTTITANAGGSTATQAIVVSASATTFAISQTQLNGGTATLNPASVAMAIGDTLTVTVSAPVATTTVTFATSMGTWSNGQQIMDVVVAGGAASANLTTLAAGVATVQVLDKVDPTLTDSLVVSMTAKIPAAITLQASSSVIPKSIGSTTGTATLTAFVTDAIGQPVGNAPVAFNIINPTGGGETVSPVIAYTAAVTGTGLTLGQAVATFTSGSLPSGQGGVQIRATVMGTAVATGTAPSGNDASIVIGGTAGSVAFGSATVISETTDKTAYVYNMSVLVADSSGTPVSGAVVSLKLWPIAWSTGWGCTVDPDTATTGTFYNEDVNENLVLDPLEDGTRRYYYGTLAQTTGTIDGALTPANSVAGTVASMNVNDAPGTVTTNANGVGAFQLTYGKNSAIWVVVRVRASTVVQGTATVGEIQFRLGASLADHNPPNTCFIPNSPFNF